MEERLAKRAAEKGITVEELKQQMKDKQKERQTKMEQKLAEIAAKRNMTVEELKQLLKEVRDAGRPAQRR